MIHFPEITVIIPALDEEAALPRTLSRLADCGFANPIVVDGGSRDRTVALAREMGARVLHSPSGRAKQMNFGATGAEGDVLFFVHADSLPALDARRLIAAALDRPGAVGGAFRLKIESRHPLLRVIALLANLRTVFFKLPYGDQGLFVRKDIFDRIGGYADLPLMEDVDLVRRLRAVGRLLPVPAPMTTSARRWERRGVLRTSCANLRRLFRYFRGVSVVDLARQYHDVR
jgi:rSAM/selenodomain-associated transferase 2